MGSFMDLLSPLWGMFSLHFALLLLVYCMKNVACLLCVCVRALRCV